MNYIDIIIIGFENIDISFFTPYLYICRNSVVRIIISIYKIILFLSNIISDNNDNGYI